MTQPAPQAPQTMDDDVIDLGRLFRAVMHYKWGILGLAFAITLLTGLMVYSLEPVYQASASIVLENRSRRSPAGRKATHQVEEFYSLRWGFVR